MRKYMCPCTCHSILLLSSGPTQYRLVVCCLLWGYKVIGAYVNTYLIRGGSRTIILGKLTSGGLGLSPDKFSKLSALNGVFTLSGDLQ